MFGTPVPFDEAYPTVENITVKYRENGYMIRPYFKGLRTYTKEDLAPSTSCNNISCKQGGFSIQSVIREMVREKQTTLNTTIGCKGHEGSPKGRRRGRACMNHAELDITIKYKEASE
jgi:hypothetical protein